MKVQRRLREKGLWREVNKHPGLLLSQLAGAGLGAGQDIPSSNPRRKSRNPPSLISIISLCCCALNIYQSQESVSFHPTQEQEKLLPSCAFNFPSWFLIPHDFLLVRKSAYPIAVSWWRCPPKNSQLIVFRKLQVLAIGSGGGCGGGLVVSPVALG